MPDRLSPSTDRARSRQWMAGLSLLLSLWWLAYHVTAAAMAADGTVADVARDGLAATATPTHAPVITVIALPFVPVTATPTPTPFVEPDGCQAPPDDYARVQLGYATLNARTLAMLDHAQQLYWAQGGYVDFRLAITQGSYNAGGEAASFGTHDGGGAVDLSVRSRINWEVLWDEIEPMIRALRVAGFAAWLRDADELYPGSPIHIHAVAIGDRDASEAARAQLDGTFGYLRGFDGLPQPDGVPRPDRHGGPVLCQWMRDLGYADLRGLPVPTATPGGTARPGLAHDNARPG